MPQSYTEDQLCEQPTIGLFAELGWTTVSALEEFFGKGSCKNNCRLLGVKYTNSASVLRKEWKENCAPAQLKIRGLMIIGHERGALL